MISYMTPDPLAVQYKHRDFDLQSDTSLAITPTITIPLSSDPLPYKLIPSIFKLSNPPPLTHLDNFNRHHISPKSRHTTISLWMGLGVYDFKDR